MTFCEYDHLRDLQFDLVCLKKLKKQNVIVNSTSELGARSYFIGQSEMKTPVLI